MTKMKRASKQEVEERTSYIYNELLAGEDRYDIIRKIEKEANWGVGPKTIYLYLSKAERRIHDELQRSRPIMLARIAGELTAQKRMVKKLVRENPNRIDLHYLLRNLIKDDLDILDRLEKAAEGFVPENRTQLLLGIGEMLESAGLTIAELMPNEMHGADIADQIDN